MNRVSVRSFHVLLGLLVLTGIINISSWSTDAFNVETRHFASYEGPSNSMFGFSVAEYRDNNTRGWVIVGAPQADAGQPRTERGGAVYRCNIADEADCTILVFDSTGFNTVNRTTPPPWKVIQIDNKTMQWFGATVATSRKDGGPILACAPRYTFFGIAGGMNRMWEEDDIRSRELAFGNQRDPVGTCFLKNDQTKYSTVKEFSPCRTRNYGYPKQGSCQAGFSAALSKNGERIYVGAPGSWYWQGQMYSLARRTEDYSYVPPSIGFYGQDVLEVTNEGQTYVMRKGGKVLFTKAWPQKEDDTYLGYSMVVGDFSGTGQIGTAVGKPRGAELRGQVLLLLENTTIMQTINGTTMGSYFGYSLAAGDLDNDGLDDLIVGAPMFTVPDNSVMNFETGRIYVYYGKSKYTEYTHRDGDYNRSRFGLSIAYLGDIDRDGYGDIAVGAPYGGPGGRGAVYIYQGSANGLLEKYSQVIYGQDVDSSVQTFGFSIAGGLDLDNNLYPDIVVGSYESNRAMFFRSRPVIKMVPENTYVRFVSTTKIISLEDKSCILSDKGRTHVACLYLKTCFQYTGDGVRSKYRFNVQYVLDPQKPQEPRLCFSEHEGRHQINQTIEVYQNQPFCRTVKVYVVPNIRDKLTPLDAEMRMTLEDELRADNRPRNLLLPLRPILAITSSRKDAVAILKNCGPDNICTPDLQMECVPSVTEYLMGSETKIELNITVQNMKEDAFEATYYLTLPPGIEYTNVLKVDTSEILVPCSPLKEADGQVRTIKCDIGNPLPNRRLVKFIVYLKPITEGVHEEISSYKFEMITNSSNPELFDTTDDNYKTIEIAIAVNTELLIEGESKRKEVYYNPDNYTSMEVKTEIEYGPGFMHNYTIRNRGPSSFEEAEIILRWPIKTLEGDDILYLIEQPETSKKIKCATANANALSLKLEQKHRGSHGSYSPIPPYTGQIGKNWTATGETAHGGGSQGTVTGTGGGRFVATGTASNSSHTVTTGSDGTVTETRDEWTNNHGVIQSKNVTSTATEERTKVNYGVTRGQGEGNIDYEQRTRVQGEEIRPKPSEFIYGTERHYENNGGSTNYGGSSHDFSHNSGSSVLATGIRTEDRISGDREETVGGSDFDIRVRNVTASQDLDRILSTLTKGSAGSKVYTREGKTYLQFLGRFRVSADQREYIEFKEGFKFPLEDRYGDQSYAGGDPNVALDQRYRRIDGFIVISKDGKGYVQLQDGRKFPLQGSYTYTEERTYTRGGGGVRQQGGSTFSSERRGTTDSYGQSWSEESSNRESEYGREIERHNSRTHEERRTYETNVGSRVYGAVEETDNPYGDVSAQYRSGIHKRGSRHRREGDAISVDDFRKYEKLHRLHKRDVNDYDNDEATIKEENLQKNDESIGHDCKGVHCVTLQCTVGRLEKDEEVWISARYRIKGTTLQKIAPTKELKISTELAARVTKVLRVGRPANGLVKTQEVYTILKPEQKKAESGPVPLWVVVLSACAGVIILLLLILMLHKCGFFKRNRPTDAPERQPLNRNGHFQGDDHL